MHLADASDAIIIGFNVVPDEKARALAEQRGVQIRRYDIIYQVTDDLKTALEGMLKPEQREVELGRALVQRTFTISRVGTIAGCRVLAGTIERNCRVRVIRENRIIGDYPLESLQARKGRRPRGPRRLGVRHQAGRLQRPEGRRHARGVQDRGSGADAVMRGLNDIAPARDALVIRVQQNVTAAATRLAARRPTFVVTQWRNPLPISELAPMTSRRVQKAAQAIREVVSMAILTE